MVERVEKAEEKMLPASKIRTIMKSCGDPNNPISAESVIVVSKAAELFITYLAQQTQRKNTGNRELNYEDLASFVQHNNKLEFLHEILPEKITVKQFREILARGDQSDSDNNTSDSDEDSSLTNDDDDEDDDDDDEDDSEGDK